MYKNRLSYISRILVLLASILLLNTTILNAEEIPKAIAEKLAAQEAKIAQLEKLLTEKLAPQHETATIKKEVSTTELAEKQDESKIEYKKGYSISGKTDDKPYAIKINGRMQFRYNGFARKDRNYKFDDGTTGVQSNQSDFEIERGRLEFSGFVADPKLNYYLNLDFDTDDNHDVKAHDFWFNYKFSEAFDLYAGKAFVPGSREWLDGSTTTHLADRSLATSFFRPDRSVGVWAIGEPVEDLNYRFMVSNGFNTTDLNSDQIDDQFTYALSLWGDVMGEYGKGRADLEHHENTAIRIGSSFTYSPISAGVEGEPLEEADSIRLSNGTKLDSTGALAPGVTVDGYDIFLYAVDASLKYRGFSINSEAYYRAIQNIVADGTIPDNSVDDYGFYIDSGYFIYRSALEAVIRYSYINGDQSNSSEYATGFNYYLNGTHLNKLTLDASRLDNSPVNSSGPNYRVGDTGVLYRLQWQVGF